MLSQGKLLRDVLILNMDKQLEDISATMYEKEISALNAEEVYIVVIFMVKRLIETYIKSIAEKKYYYISSGFGKGSFLESNLRNLGIYEIMKGVLVSKNHDLESINEVEKEYLGRQESFEETTYKFFEQSAQYGLPSEAIGIRQIKKYEDKNTEYVPYQPEKSWLVKQDMSFSIALEKIKTKVCYYDLDVVGKDKGIYKFHLFDLEIEDAMGEEEAQIYYDYFLCHCAARLILQQMRANQYDLRRMDQYAVIGIEGKYMAFLIPEFVRIMMDEKAIPFEETIEVVRKIFGFTTYQKMIEAVETCPLEYVEKLVPHFIDKIKNAKITKEIE
ncbi:MAG: glycogen/starch/alpha-glucan phosphorylase [Lachnospiraceae bacterium]|nr:glycogen/starch/alpha-glucan phosphorylase [Lachnospiraceae bacterium]